MNWQFLFLSHEGRIAPKDFWTGALILFVIWFLSNLLHVLAPVIWLLLLYPWVCIYAKRLHDFGKSGWLVLVPLLGAFGLFSLALIAGGMAAVSTIFSAMTGDMQPESWAVLFGALGLMFVLLMIAALVKVVFLLWVGLSRGDPGENRYGPPGAPAPGA